MAQNVSLAPEMVRTGWVLMAGLDQGWLTRAHAVAWADRWIARLDEPPDRLIELAMPDRATTYDLTVMIRDVVDEPTVSDRFAIDVALLHRRFIDREVSVFQAGEALYRLWTAIRDDLPGVDRSEVVIIDHTCELAAEGVYATPAEATDRFVRFATSYATSWAGELALLAAAR